MWKGRAAFSRERPRPIVLRAVAIASLERWTLKYLCCELGSMKFATRSAAAAPNAAPPRFLSLTIRRRLASRPRAVSGCPSQGLRLGCRPFAPLPRGGDTGAAGRGPERGTTGTFNRQQELMYGGNPPIASGVGRVAIYWACLRGRQGDLMDWLLHSGAFVLDDYSPFVWRQMKTLSDRFSR
jgi:hypothetical protein